MPIALSVSGYNPLVRQICTCTKGHIGLIELSRKDQQQAFFQGIAGLNQATVLNQYEGLVKEDEKAECCSQGGRFLPLSVWRMRGHTARPAESEQATL